MNWYSYRWTRRYGNGESSGSGTIQAWSDASAQQLARTIVVNDNGFPPDADLIVSIRRLKPVRPDQDQSQQPLAMERNR